MKKIFLSSLIVSFALFALSCCNMLSIAQAQIIKNHACCKTQPVKKDNSSRTCCTLKANPADVVSISKSIDLYFNGGQSGLVALEKNIHFLNASSQYFTLAKSPPIYLKTHNFRL